jgi:hypothetical protein
MKDTDVVVMSQHSGKAKKVEEEVATKPSE